MLRKDYPRPQWVREKWYCLNGEWEFAFDFGKSGEARGMVNAGDYPMSIVVPFCPESQLSGIEYTDFMSAVWYRRTLTFLELPEGRAILHFGAVDYFCKVWVNGVFCGSHRGGYTAFEMDITDALKCGANIIVVYVEDELRSGRQAHGKQSRSFEPWACSLQQSNLYDTIKKSRDNNNSIQQRIAIIFEITIKIKLNRCEFSSHRCDFCTYFYAGG